MRGLFVTFEGIDRSGKSTQARMLCDALGPDCVVVREPGGTVLGEQLRAILKDPEVTLDPRAEALLFAAARAELVVGVIRPGLEAGKTVVSDRFLDSSLAYQGAARGLGAEEVASANALAVEGLTPDLTIYLTLDPALAFGRAGRADRIEEEGEAFQKRVAQAYERMAADEPGRWERITADRPPEEVHADVLAAVVDRRGGVAPDVAATRTLDGTETPA